MVFSIEGIIFLFVFIDALFANIVAWFYLDWYEKKKWHKLIPITKIWAAWYFILVIWIGSLLGRFGILI